MQKKFNYNVVSVVGTRPEIVRLSKIFNELDNHFNHIIVHTGQNFDYELSNIFFKDLNLRKPDYFLNCGKSSISASNTIGKIISNFDKVLEKKNIDAVLVLGDTNSCLSVIAAKKRKIPIFHIEAGNRCFDQRVPEEINRKIVDHISDINMTYSSISREYLIKEGFPPDQIIKIGSPMFEVIENNLKKIKKSKILNKLKIKKNNYILFSIHREENLENRLNFNNAINTLNMLAKEYNKIIIVSTHPRTQKKLNTYKVKFNKKIIFIKPLGFCDYINLQMNSKVVLSDSGTITEESSILGFPALNIRECHERPEGMEEASVMMSGLEFNKIKYGISILEKNKQLSKKKIQIVKDYDVKNVSVKVVRIIYSYIDYINQKIWKKTL